MNNQIKSALIFSGYQVDKICFQRNNNFSNRESVSIQLNIIPEIKVSDDERDMIVVLKTEVFKDAEANNYPFEMSIIMSGYFSMEGDCEEVSTVRRMQKNAVAILFPYVRALISTYTANANIEPLILPAINVNELFRVQDKKES